MKSLLLLYDMKSIFPFTGEEAPMYKSMPVQEPQHRDDFLRCESQPFPEFSALTHIAALPTNSSARGKLDADVLCQTQWLTTKSHSSKYPVSCRVDRRWDWLITNTIPGTCSAVWSASSLADLPHFFFFGQVQEKKHHYILDSKWMDMQIGIIFLDLMGNNSLHYLPRGVQRVWLSPWSRAHRFFVRWTSVCGPTHKRCWYFWHSRW